MLPDQVTLLLERVRHGRAVGKVAVETAHDQQPRIAAYLHRVAIAAVWRKYSRGIVRNHGHAVVSLFWQYIAIEWQSSAIDIQLGVVPLCCKALEAGAQV